jgi:hypothetical protein
MGFLAAGDALQTTYAPAVPDRVPAMHREHARRRAVDTAS